MFEPSNCSTFRLERDDICFRLSGGRFEGTGARSTPPDWSSAWSALASVTVFTLSFWTFGAPSQYSGNDCSSTVFCDWSNATNLNGPVPTGCARSWAEEPWETTGMATRFDNN